MNERKEPLGSFWIHESKKGVKYMSGVIEIPADAKPGDKIEVVMFRNDKGGVEKRPDYRMFISEKRDGAGAQADEFGEDVPF